MSRKLSLSKETLQVLTEALAVQGAMPTDCYLRFRGTLPLSLGGSDCFRTRG